MNEFTLSLIGIYCSIWLPLATYLYITMPEKERRAKKGLKAFITLLITGTVGYTVYAIFKKGEGVWW